MCLLCCLRLQLKREGVDYVHFLKTSVVLLTLTSLGIGVCSATAQTAPAQPSATQRTVETATKAIDGPPAPIAPEVVNRDAKGRATIRASRITTPLVIDGRLTENIYTQIKSAGDWVQQLPIEGEIGRAHV